MILKKKPAVSPVAASCRKATKRVSKSKLSIRGKVRLQIPGTENGHTVAPDDFVVDDLRGVFRESPRAVSKKNSRQSSLYSEGAHRDLRLPETSEGASKSKVFGIEFNPNVGSRKKIESSGRRKMSVVSELAPLREPKEAPETKDSVLKGKVGESRNVIAPDETVSKSKKPIRVSKRPKSKTKKTTEETKTTSNEPSKQSKSLSTDSDADQYTGMHEDALQASNSAPSTKTKSRTTPSKSKATTPETTKHKKLNSTKVHSKKPPIRFRPTFVTIDIGRSHHSFVVHRFQELPAQERMKLTHQQLNALCSPGKDPMDLLGCV